MRHIPKVSKWRINIEEEKESIILKRKLKFDLTVIFLDKKEMVEPLLKDI